MKYVRGLLICVVIALAAYGAFQLYKQCFDTTFEVSDDVRRSLQEAGIVLNETVDKNGVTHLFDDLEGVPSFSEHPRSESVPPTFRDAETEISAAPFCQPSSQVPTMLAPAPPYGNPNAGSAPLYHQQAPAQAHHPSDNVPANGTPGVCIIPAPSVSAPVPAPAPIPTPVPAALDIPHLNSELTTPPEPLPDWYIPMEPPTNSNTIPAESSAAMQIPPPTPAPEPVLSPDVSPVASSVSEPALAQKEPDGNAPKPAATTTDFRPGPLSMFSSLTPPFPSAGTESAPKITEPASIMQAPVLIESPVDMPGTLESSVPPPSEVPTFPYPTISPPSSPAPPPTALASTSAPGNALIPAVVGESSAVPLPPEFPVPEIPNTLPDSGFAVSGKTRATSEITPVNSTIGQSLEKVIPLPAVIEEGLREEIIAQYQNITPLFESQEPPKLKDGYIQLSRLFFTPDLTPEEKRYIGTSLNQVAGGLFFSPKYHVIEPPYTVREGDSMESIAKELQVTPELLWKINGFILNTTVQPGMKIKVIRGPLEARVYPNTCELIITNQGNYVCRFKIGVGLNYAGQKGTFAVQNKQNNPVYDLGFGLDRIEANDPNNPLGCRWIQVSQMANNIGIHGTNHPELVGIEGRSVAGVFFMKNEDVIEVCDMLVPGSTVIIER